MKNSLLRTSICLAVIISPFIYTPFAATGDELPTDAAHQGVGVAPPVESTRDYILLKVPLSSPHFTDTPVALVNDEPIFLSELAGFLSQKDRQMNEETGNKENENLSSLNRLINTRLIVQEAINIGLDETEAMRTQVEDFKNKALQQELMTNHLQGLEPSVEDVDEVYKKISREVKLHTLTFEQGFEAQKFLEDLKDNDFEQLVEKYVEEGKIKEQKEEDYVKIKDLLTQIGQKVYSMKEGEVSNVFRTGDGFLLFRLMDSRFVEDPGVKDEAIKIVTDSLRKQKAMEYGNMLAEKYVDFNDELYEQLDFNQDLEQLKGDKRVIATVNADEPIVITVADLLAQVEGASFHGADKAQNLGVLNRKKDIAITNMLFKHTSKLEAHRQGLDQTGEFKRKVEEFERSLLFNAFMNKVIVPDVQLNPEEVRSYYDEHIDEYSSPAMLRMSSLVFDNRQNAENALDKLHKGADFNWVSANATGFVSPDTKGVLDFNQNILSMTALPEDLQQNVREVHKGDSLLYKPTEGEFYYVLIIEDIFPPEPQPYEKAKKDAAKIVYNKKIEALMDEWITKLKEAYNVQIFLYDTGK